MSIFEKIQKVQETLKAPKNQYNSFGKYKYRSCEDILEGVKPLLANVKATVTISDDVKEVGGRVYVVATATITDAETGEHFSTTAMAREPMAKKGMDESQITGMASSYARKYALNGLFAIDDTKDADTQPRPVEDAQQPKQQAAVVMCQACGKQIVAKDKWPVPRIVQHTQKQYGKTMCIACWQAQMAKDKQEQAQQEQANQEEEFVPYYTED